MRRSVLPVALAAVVVAVVAGAVSAFLASGSSDRTDATVAPSALPAADIVFTRHLMKPDRSDLYVIAVDGSHLRLLVRNAAHAAVTRDGRRIAFVRGGGIWIMERDGTRQRRLMLPGTQPRIKGERPVVSASDPAWSPTGRTLFFLRQERYTMGVLFSIFSIRDDGTHLVRLAGGGGGRYGGLVGDPSPSPDGQVIAFSGMYDTDHGGEGAIFAVSLAGEAETLRLTFPGEYEDVSSHPTWSPDRRRMAYAFEDVQFYGVPGPDPSGLYVSRPDGSPQRLPVGDSWLGGDPAWSPDGDWITFDGDDGTSEETYSGDVWLVRPDGTGLRQLTRTAADDGDAAWVPRAA